MNRYILYKEGVRQDFNLYADKHEVYDSYIKFYSIVDNLDVLIAVMFGKIEYDEEKKLYKVYINDY